MAHSLSLKYVCQRCSKMAVEEVFNRHNSSSGRFCRKHAREKLAALRVLEGGRK